MVPSCLKLRHGLVVCLLALFTLAVMARPDWSGDLPGCITVCNEASESVYVVIGDRNQGPVDVGCTETFEVPFGEFKVEAEGYDETASRWMTVYRSSPNATWTVCDEDLQ